jgi:hypothetical protein
MATRKTVPPFTVNDSKPADPNKPFILRDLPAEIRNQIYGYLVEHPTPLRIHCNSSGCYCISDIRLRIDPEVQISVGLFASCRTLYRDAASAFYSNNNFTIQNEQLWPRTRDHCDPMELLISVWRRPSMRITRFLSP